MIAADFKSNAALMLSRLKNKYQSALYWLGQKTGASSPHADDLFCEQPLLENTNKSKPKPGDLNVVKALGTGLLFGVGAGLACVCNGLETGSFGGPPVDPDKIQQLAYISSFSVIYGGYRIAKNGLHNALVSLALVGVLGVPFHTVYTTYDYEAEIKNRQALCLKIGGQQFDCINISKDSTYKDFKCTITPPLRHTNPDNETLKNFYLKGSRCYLGL